MLDSTIHSELAKGKKQGSMSNTKELFREHGKLHENWHEYMTTSKNRTNERHVSDV